MSTVPSEPKLVAATLADTRAQWELDKIEFARVVLKEAQTFMRHDNAVVANLATISTSLAQYADVHPDRVFGGAADDAQPGDLTGGGIGSEIFTMITKIITDDKEFFLGLIGKLFGL